MGHRRTDDSGVERWAKANNRHAGSSQCDFLSPHQRVWMAKPSSHAPQFGTVRRKARFATITPNGVASGFGTKFTMLYENGSAKKRDARRLPVQEALIPKASNRLERRDFAVSTREKKINGVKRHIAVDTLGLLLVIVVHSACPIKQHCKTGTGPNWLWKK